MKYTQIGGGGSHSIALLDDGVIYTWGSNQEMQLGQGDKEEYVEKPQELADLHSVRAVAAGYDFSVALRNGGKVYTWGGGIQDKPTQVSDLPKAVAVSAGLTDVLALTQDGTVYQWRIGEVPAEVPGLSNIAAIDAGGRHFLALTTYGDVYAWGSNGNGQLGLGDTENRTVPERVELVNIVDVAAGSSHSLAVAFDGTVYAWGSNLRGELGDGTTTESTRPVTVDGLKEAEQVAAGNQVSMAITADGKLYVWGNGEYGQLGTGGYPNAQKTPAAVSTLTGVREVAAGMFHGLAVTDDGELYTWGRNQHNQLGIVEGENQPTPRRMAGAVLPANFSYGVTSAITVNDWAVTELVFLYSKALVPPLLWQNYQDNITRAEFSHMLVNIYEQVNHTQLSPGLKTQFSDIENHILKADIMKAFRRGIIQGISETQFAPEREITREEAAVMLLRFMERIENTQLSPENDDLSYYSDGESVAWWAKPSVAYMAEKEIMRGVGDGRFLPGGYLTREQALLLAARLMKKYEW